MDQLIIPTIQLSLLLGFLIYKIKPSFIAHMKTRHGEMSEVLNRAKMQTAQADSRKKEVEAKFANLLAEKESIFADWKERQNSQLAAIKESTPKVLTQMKVESEQNKKSLEVQIRAQVMKSIADQILSRVEDKVKAGLTVESHKAINEQFMKEVSA